MKDSTIRTIRTVVQTIIGSGAAAATIALIPEVAAIPQAVIALSWIGVAAKIMNVLEDNNLIPPLGYPNGLLIRDRRRGRRG